MARLDLAALFPGQANDHTAFNNVIPTFEQSPDVLDADLEWARETEPRRSQDAQDRFSSEPAYRDALGASTSDLATSNLAPDSLDQVNAAALSHVVESDELVGVDQTSHLLSFVDSPSSPHGVGEVPRCNTGITIAAHLSGMFFAPKFPILQQESHVTCYRRNLFRVGGSILVPKNLDQKITRAGFQKIKKLYAKLTAKDTLKADSVKVITAPLKTKKSREDNSSDSVPSPVTLNFRVSKSQSSDFCSFTLDWARMQFRVATEKSGRRTKRPQQQYFILSIHVVASLVDGSEIVLCESRSAPISVRGRCPRNFEPSKSGVKTLENPRKRARIDQSPNLSPQEDAMPWLEEPTNDDVMLLRDTMSENNVLDNESPFRLWDWNISTASILGTDTGGIDLFSQEYSEAGAVDLEDIVGLSGKVPSVEEESFYKYEYIPLSPGDRTSPVQAVYQPHGVHHKICIPKKSSKMNTRYFGELSDVGIVRRSSF